MAGNYIEFKSIHIDTEKGIYKINGEKVPNISYLELYFKDGKWSLFITRDELFRQREVTELNMKLIIVVSVVTTVLFRILLHLLGA